MATGRKGLYEAYVSIVTLQKIIPGWLIEKGIHQASLALAQSPKGGLGV